MASNIITTDLAAALSFSRLIARWAGCYNTFIPEGEAAQVVAYLRRAEFDAVQDDGVTLDVIYRRQRGELTAEVVVDTSDSRGLRLRAKNLGVLWECMLHFAEDSLADYCSVEEHATEHSKDDEEVDQSAKLWDYLLEARKMKEYYEERLPRPSVRECGRTLEIITDLKGRYARAEVEYGLRLADALRERYQG